jgi:hypothetical protein
VATIGEGLARLGSGRSILALMPGTHVVTGLKFTTEIRTLVGVDDAGVRLCPAAARPRIASTTPTGLEGSGGSITVWQLIIAADAGTPAQRSSYGAFVTGGHSFSTTRPSRLGTGRRGASLLPHRSRRR